MSKQERGRGRPKEFGEQILSRHVEGTIEQITAALDDGETRADFLRTAIDREIGRRTGKPPVPKPAASTGKMPTAEDWADLNERLRAVEQRFEDSTDV